MTKLLMQTKGPQISSTVTNEIFTRFIIRYCYRNSVHLSVTLVIHA